MTRILIACLFAGMSVPAVAGSADDLEDAMQELRDWKCGADAEVATRIMRFRQAGGPMGDLIDAELADRFREFVFEAYEAPRETTEAARRMAAEEFGNQAALACHEREADGPKD